ncbi:YiiD C-terminal domain-containing protein [Marinobacter litoralis]|uniref:YiiD C-terminal domain-containing protein n=1 Tax=Marinobacter litoralis TaxID=187981 RepID=UPI0018EDDFF6|nr:YiiD C-terminal domain-containing protein [Marinobacter litoralis]MBJ6137873.1 YiiD C-terminal domain-containing protein [Marinobacter litoralis]
MAVIDKLIGTAGQWVGHTDANATLLQPLEWIKKTGSYTAINRIVGMAIPFTTRNGFSVQEVRPGYVRAKVKLKGNKNHFGSLYAGAYFLVAEIPGGILALFDLGPAYTPILKSMTLEFLQPADSDVEVEFTLPEETVAAVLADADATGRGKFTLEGVLRDKDGNHVATSYAQYRVRKKGFKPQA